MFKEKQSMKVLFAVLLIVTIAPKTLAQTKEVEDKKALPFIKNTMVGVSRKDLFKVYPKTQERTYRKGKNREWITFDYEDKKKKHGVITFHLKDDRVVGWELNNREEVVKEYLTEFCSQAFIQYCPKIYTAIKNILVGLPDDAFLFLTNRQKPVLFTEYYHIGMGRFANSSEIRFFENDPPAFTDGLWIVKLSMELNEANTEMEIEGVVAHELAHKVLGHSNSAVYSHKMEKEADDLVKKWGFDAQLSMAKRRFGRGSKEIKGGRGK